MGGPVAGGLVVQEVSSLSTTGRPLLAGDALQPFRWAGLVLLVAVPFAQPQHVLRCSWNLTNGAWLGARGIFEVKGSLNPGLKMPPLLACS